MKNNRLERVNSELQKEIAMIMKVPKNEYNVFLEVLGKLELEMKVQKNRKSRYRILFGLYISKK